MCIQLEDYFTFFLVKYWRFTFFARKRIYVKCAWKDEQYYLSRKD